MSAATDGLAVRGTRESGMRLPDVRARGRREGRLRGDKEPRHQVIELVRTLNRHHMRRSVALDDLELANREFCRRPRGRSMAA